MHHNQKQLPNRFSEGDPPLLFLRMLQIGLNKQEGVSKNCCRLLKIYTVSSHI